jgi:hypothetical protein
MDVTKAFASSWASIQEDFSKIDDPFSRAFAHEQVK